MMDKKSVGISGKIRTPAAVLEMEKYRIKILKHLTQFCLYKLTNLYNPIFFSYIFN